MDLEQIRTRIVRDRVRETPWSHREYVHDLSLIEALLGGKRLGWAFHVSGKPRPLHADYPAEAECIRLESQEGVYIPPETFRTDRERYAAAWALRIAERERRRAEHQASEEERRRREWEELERRRYDTWVDMGGLP